MLDELPLDAMRRVQLLEGLPREVLLDVAADCRFKRYRARQTVIDRDDVDRDCYLILAGRLRVIAWSPGGREVSFRDAGAGETIGELAAIDGRPPLLLLDDVFSELDPARRSHLVQRIGVLPQAFVTTTTLDDLDPALVAASTAWTVTPGSLERA